MKPSFVAEEGCGGLCGLVVEELHTPKSRLPGFDPHWYQGCVLEQDTLSPRSSTYS